MTGLKKLYDFTGTITFPADDIDDAMVVMEEMIDVLEDHWDCSISGDMEEAALYADEE